LSISKINSPFRYKTNQPRGDSQKTKKYEKSYWNLSLRRGNPVLIPFTLIHIMENNRHSALRTATPIGNSLSHELGHLILGLSVPTLIPLNGNPRQINSPHKQHQPQIRNLPTPSHQLTHPKKPQNHHQRTPKSGGLHTQDPHHKSEGQRHHRPPPTNKTHSQ